MGVVTTADERVEQLKESIEQAFQLLKNLTLEEPWGIEDYNEPFRQALEEHFQKIRAIRKHLKENG